MGVKQLTWRRYLVALAAGALVLSALVWYASPERVVEVISSADWRLLGAAWLVTLAATVVRTFRFAVFVPVHGRLIRAYGAFSLARFLNLALPFRSGEVAMLAVLKRVGIAPTISHLLPAWAILRMTDALALAAWFSLVVSVSTIGRDYLPISVGILAAILVAICFVDRLSRVVPANYFENRSSWFAGRLKAVVEGLESARSVSARFLAIGAGLVLWALLITSSVLTQQAFDTPLGWTEATLVAVFVYAFSLLPLNTPLGVGSGEILWTAAMVLVGLPLEIVVPLAVAVRLAMLTILFIEGTIGAILVLNRRPSEGKTEQDGAIGNTM